MMIAEQFAAAMKSGIGLPMLFIITVIGVCAAGAIAVVIAKAAWGHRGKFFASFRSIWTPILAVLLTWLPLISLPWWAALLVIIAWVFVHWVHDRETTETALTAIGRIMIDLGGFAMRFARSLFAPAASVAAAQPAAAAARADPYTDEQHEQRLQAELAFREAIAEGAPAAFPDFGEHVSFPRPMPLAAPIAAKGASVFVKLTIALVALSALVGLVGWLVFGLLNQGEETAEARNETAIAHANTRTEQSRADFNADLGEETETYYRRDAAIREEADRGRDEIAAASDAAGKFAAYRAAVERMRNAADAAHAGAVQDFVSSLDA